MTCVRCHPIAGASPTPLPRAAPDLTHLAERKTIGAGLLTNNPENLTKWLQDPQRYKPGSHMPSLQLEGQKLTDLVSYLETLQ
jgi:cytochrome c oxidase subunit 2